MRAALALSLVVVTFGCATAQPHKELPRAPSKDAPYDERAKYLRAHSAEPGDPMAHGFLQLSGGERLYWPEDLLPAVDEESPTAKALATHVEKREEAATIYMWLSFPAMLSTLVSTLAVSTAFAFALSSNLGAFWMDPLFLGTSGWFLASLVVMGVGFWLQDEPGRLANETLHTAIATYPQSLEDRLGLHVDGDGNIVDTTIPGAVLGIGGLGVRGDAPLGGLVGSELPPKESDDDGQVGDDDLPPPLPEKAPR